MLWSVDDHFKWVRVRVSAMWLDEPPKICGDFFFRWSRRKSRPTRQRNSIVFAAVSRRLSTLSPLNQTNTMRERKNNKKSIQWILQFTRRISPHFSRCRCCCVVSSMKNVMLLFCADSSACLLFHIFFSLLLIALSPHTFFFFCSSRFSIRPNADFSAKIKEDILLCSKLCT